MGTFFINKLLNQLPPIQPENYKEHSTNQMTIVQTKHVCPDVGCFDCYQFVLPYASFPPAQIDNKQYMFEKNKIFPINPGQYHQVLMPHNNDLYIPIFIEKEYLQEVARAIYGQTEVVFENKNFMPSKQLINLIHLFIEESINKQTGYEFILNALQNQFIVMLLRELKSNLPAQKSKGQHADEKGVRRVIEFMNEHCTENFSLQDIAQLTNYSPYHFIKIFKTATGKTPFQYLLELKLGRAKDMLAHKKDMTITEICHLCGFNNLSHFTAVFKKKTGVSPSKYRELVK